MPRGASRRRSRPERRRRVRRAVAAVAILAAVFTAVWGWSARADTQRHMIRAAASPTMTPGGLVRPRNESPALVHVLSSLMCRCGCNLTAYACEGTMTCDVSARMRADAQAMLTRGMTPPQVLSAFAANYGEQVIATPIKKGFNLTAWILPFAALAAGILLVGLAVKTWGGRPAPASAPPPEIDPEVRAAIEAELSEEG